MKPQTDGPDTRDLEPLLQALAADDRGARASQRTRDAVMHAWDARTRSSRVRRYARLFALGSLAAGLVGMLVSHRVPPQPSRSQTVVARVPATPPIVRESPAFSDTSQTDRASSQTPDASTPSRRSPRRPPGRVPESSDRRYEPGIVLAVDAFPDPGAVSIVRVRVPRTSLIALGIAPAVLEEGGSIELEVLVGEDGVARSIRRALPVAGQSE